MHHYCLVQHHWCPTGLADNQCPFVYKSGKEEREVIIATLSVLDTASQLLVHPNPICVTVAPVIRHSFSATSSKVLYASGSVSTLRHPTSQHLIVPQSIVTFR
jgi:hypothetical protein